ncbi:MAG: XdhC family protein, partial [Hungatella sp.]
KQALETPASYIGVMGSRNKKKIIFEKLRADGYAQEDIARFHTPIGLAISAKTPAEIAISIAAELISARAAREGKDSL